MMIQFYNFTDNLIIIFLDTIKFKHYESKTVLYRVAFSNFMTKLETNYSI